MLAPSGVSPLSPRLAKCPACLAVAHAGALLLMRLPAAAGNNKYRLSTPNATTARQHVTTPWRVDWAAAGGPRAGGVLELPSRPPAACGAVFFKDLGRRQTPYFQPPCGAQQKAPRTRKSPPAAKIDPGFVISALVLPLPCLERHEQGHM